jgi:hypothetical protein
VQDDASRDRKVKDRPIPPSFSSVALARARFIPRQRGWAAHGEGWTGTRRVGSQRTVAAGGAPFVIIVPAVACGEILSVVVGCCLHDGFCCVVGMETVVKLLAAGRAGAAVATGGLGRLGDHRGCHGSTTGTAHDRGSGGEGAHRGSKRAHDDAPPPVRRLIDDADADLLLLLRDDLVSRPRRRHAPRATTRPTCYPISSHPGWTV